MAQIATLIKDNVSIHFQNEPLESAWEIFPGQSVWLVYTVARVVGGNFCCCDFPLNGGTEERPPHSQVGFPPSPALCWAVPSPGERACCSSDGCPDPGREVTASFFGPLSKLKGFYLTYKCDQNTNDWFSSHLRSNLPWPSPILSTSMN